MKVLHLAGNLEDAGGILSVIRHLQTATKDQGWQHSVFVNRCYVETRQPVLDYRTSRFVCSEMASHWRILWRAALALIEAKRLVAREPFAVIHAHSRCGFLIAWGLAAWLNRPVVFTNHDYARRVRMYQRAASHPNFYTVFLTPNMARHYALTEQPPKVSVISACFSDQYFHEPLAGAAMASREGTILRLVGAGSLLRWKKWDLLVRALQRLGESERKQIEVSIWGPVVQSDPDSRRYEAELRQQILTEGLGERVRLRGTTHAMSEAMRQA
ncbi:MAG: glycosyltransferase, partial [Verrucomicrobia bacterium]|nr:glycosyltransferase [Verrucomicrobiota bacterium]